MKLQTNNFFLKGKINITGSKSESNRLLILKALYPNIINIKNLSNSDDTYFLKKALFTTKKVININHSGTAMRFLTAFFSIKKKKEILLTGSYRMQERPIYILVETLNKLGGKICYEKKNGYPPLRIIGSNFLGGTISIDANLSSQYISAILLIASQFKNGLKIFLSKKITSLSYIKMTFKILNKIGINVYWKQNLIILNNKILKQNQTKKILIESDWSSASYYYSLVAFCKKANLNLKFFTKKSIQGDKVITNIYNSFFNVKTFFKQKKFILKKKRIKRKTKYIFIDLNSTPDIAQTIVVTCAGFKIQCFLTGLETLKIKETDRLKALKIELFKLGIKSMKTNNSLLLNNFNFKKQKMYIYTYDDHRMAMSFSTLSIIYPISILDPYVVYKSYPNFWIDLKKLGFLFKTKQL
ncbi:MAG: 3-phosphoshikimate 1-carboxyvinyltransferase [Candidatus Karelsulcia muelleri]